ncbi:hypothetical protein K6V71_04185 [Cupriavidus gilardii]|uniref:hypothetical protein n=1 Tax=Cupriavidus gilardii TaxID=82541 RepID=UPI0021B17C7E|nr:hypothetical protein [Cupriavidus gilardii]UXC37885.1 hypothetical protein N4G38_22580 [Cupriavidus gilardii]
MTIQAIDNIVEEIKKVPEPELTQFHTEFVSKLSGGIVRCLDPDAKPYGIRAGEPYEILFREPVYVSSVEIVFTKSTVGANIELAISDALSAKIVRQRISEDSLADTVTFRINAVTSGVSIYLPNSYTELFRKKTLEVKLIRIAGFPAEDFTSLSSSLTRLLTLREAALEHLTAESNRLKDREEHVEQRETAVAQLEVQKAKELADLEAEVDEAKSDALEAKDALASLKEDIAKAGARKQVVQDQIAAQEASARSIDAEISKAKEQLTALASQTSEAERRLQQLTSNVNLFSEEFSSFSDHGAKQARTFLGLSIVPLVVIAALTLHLLLGAVDLSVKYTTEPNLDLLTVFVTRLPYLAVCASILGLCYSALQFLFRRISIIYAERLDFAKIGIIAKDVATASSVDLDMDDKQRYEARTFLKIELLRSYLSGNIGAFTYTKRSEAKHGASLGDATAPPRSSSTAEDKDEDE